MDDDLAFFTQYLPVGKHGHKAFKRAYFNACRDFVGTEWKQAMRNLQDTGRLYMTDDDTHGEKVDFFTAVIIARHDAKPVEGYIEIYG